MKKRMGAGPAALVASTFGKRSKGRRGRSLLPRRNKRSAIRRTMAKLSSKGGRFRRKRRGPELTTIVEGVGTLVGAAAAGAQVVSELRRAGRSEQSEEEQGDGAEGADERPPARRRARSASSSARGHRHDAERDEERPEAKGAEPDGEQAEGMPPQQEQGEDQQEEAGDERGGPATTAESRGS
jgi:hypothetical protein